MLQALKSPFLKSKPILLIFFLAALLNGCKSDFFSEKEVVQKIIEANVWCDYMPGTPPRTNAVMRCTLRNITNQEIIIKRADGLLVDAKSTSQLRRFQSTMLVDEVQQNEVHLLPNRPVEIVLRTPTKLVMPIDIDAYNQILFVVKCETNFDQNIVITSPVIKPVKTQ